MSVSHVERTDPVLCEHRQAPWLPLCEHAGRAEASELTDDDIGRTVTTSEGSGVLHAFHKIDDLVVQLILSPNRGLTLVTNTPAGEVVRIGWPLPGLFSEE